MNDAARASRHARSRILVVDDEDDVRQLVARILQDADFEVEVAADGAEAIERLTTVAPDLVVLDIMMPGVDGWKVLGHIKDMEAPPTVLVLTGRADSDTLQRATREGAAAVVSKPFRFEELLARCQGLMALRDWPAREGEAVRRTPRAC
jgi:CheY-like chemotaxis protein